MELNDFYRDFFGKMKEGIQRFRETSKFVKKQTKQPKFGYFQTNKLDKEQMRQIHSYVKERVDDMIVSEFVSATEFMDMFGCWLDNFPEDEDMYKLLLKIKSEKQFIDDIIDVYELHGLYILCPERYSVRHELCKIWSSEDYNSDLLRV